MVFSKIWRMVIFAEVSENKFVKEKKSGNLVNTRDIWQAV